MSARTRALVIALLLGLVASAIAIVFETLNLNVLPSVNRIADLVVHVSALDKAKTLGFGEPAYDTTPNPNLGIITYDDYTQKSGGAGGIFNAFPIPRSVYGKVLENLKAAGAKTVAFDIDFVDPARNPEDDAIFAAGLRKLPSVLAFLLNTTSTGNIGEEQVAPTLRPYVAAVGDSTIDKPGGYMIGQAMEIDTGSTGKHSNERIHALAEAAVATYEGHPLDLASIPKGPNGVMLLLPPSFEHPQDITTGTESLVVGYAGRGVMHFIDAYTSTPEQLRTFAKGALIYIGATYQGGFDFATTTRPPGATPGLLINARLADQLMRGYYLRPAPLWLDLLLTLLLPVIPALVFTLLRTTTAIIVSVVATALVAYVNLYFFIDKLYWVNLVHVCAAMLLGTMFVAVYRVINEGSQRRMVTNMFGMHVSPAVVADILNQDDPKGALALKGKRVKATIFYSDIRGFTSMSETMTPEEIYGQLNEYFEEMCAIIFEHGGYVDKFIGDCVMAVFSAPYQTPDDASNAVVSAVKQQDKILELSAKWKAMGKKEFTVGMGVNTGDVVMGNLGSSTRMNYTVIGDNVNVAARLYNVAKGGEIIISETTYAECKDLVEVDELEPVSVKGKAQPIKIYNVKSLKKSAAAAAEPPPELQPA